MCRHALSLDGRVCSRRHLLLGAGLSAGLAAGLGWARSAGRLDGAHAAPEPQDEVCIVAPLLSGERVSAWPLTAPRPLPEDARCPLCGMFPARRPEWAAQLTFDDGATQFFDSPIDLRLYLDEVPRHVRGRRAEQVVAMHVTDALAGAGHWLRVEGAHFLLGSERLGPMRGADWLAYASAEAAEAQRQRHGGEVLRWPTLLGPRWRPRERRSHHLR